MPVTAEQITHLLAQVSFPVKRLWIAYSGGLDSHALLHCCTRYRSELPEIAGAIHVHHGLSANADHWASHCHQTCEQLGIPLVVRYVELPTGEGLEDSARRARYEAIIAILQPGDVVLLAQHQDDQAETFLLQALRGGGPRGLAAMPPVASLGEGGLVRPLLEFNREAILEYARANHLNWVDDESNLDLRFERNFLRHEIMPKLTERWPAANRTLARAAAHTASLVHMADELLQDELEGIAGSRSNTLSISALKSLSSARASLLIRALCQKLQLPMPATVHVEELLHKQLHAVAGRQILVNWPGAEIRRFQDDLYIQQPLPPVPASDWRYEWNGMHALDIPEIHGRLILQPRHGSGIRQSLVKAGLTVKPRRGGECCQPSGDAHRRDLKTIFQNHHIPPWERARMPLIYHGDELLAVADIVISQGASATAKEPGYEVVWQSFH